ncbi:MAG: hypothetical protein ACR2HM_01665 [Acidimicrobiales bacterium]
MNASLTPTDNARLGPSVPGRLRRLWGAPLWAHVALLAVVLALLYPLMSPSSSYTSDEGAYALQERSLEGGSWAYDYRAGPLDPDGRAFPIILSDRGESGYFTYVKHPAYALLLRASTTVAGPVLGLHLPALLGVMGTAIAAWLLAGHLEPRLRRPAFWLAASGPVLVNGFLLWAHAPSAALAGFALLGAAHIVRGGRSRGAMGGLVVAALTCGVLLRSEGLLFAGALAVSLGAVALRRDGARRAAAVTAWVGLPPLVAALLEREWVRSISGASHETLATRSGGSSSFLAGRLSGAWHVLMQAHFGDPAAGLPLLLALVLVAGLGFVALRRWVPSSLGKLAVAVVLAAGFVALRFAGHPLDPVTGLLPAWPLAALGLLLFRWRRAGSVAHVLGGTALLFALAVLATQYAEGGGVEWGGRFLSPLVVPIAVLAAAGLLRAVDAVPGADRRRATALLAALGLTTAVFAVASVGSLRDRQDDMVAAIAQHPATITVTTRRSLPRIAWRADREVTWMLTDEAGLAGLLQHLRRAGVADVAVVTAVDVPLSDLGAYPVLEPVREAALSDSGLQMVIARDR